ncbi:MAG: flippase-like domain-containing protein [Anaeroplasmataceae bacterium]|nr:flippase-like domain-containing protein [Anaeroplasmataceae bacterium]
MEEQALEKGRKKKYIWSIAFLSILIIVTFVVIFLNYDIAELFSIIQEVNFLWLLPAVAMIFIYIYFEGAAMRQILKTMEINTTRRANFMYSAIDYYFCAVTPSASGGQPMVAYYMNRDGLSLSPVSLTLIMNTALFKIVLLILSIISAIACSYLVFQFPIMIALFVIGMTINVFLIVLCFLMTFKRKWIQAVGLRLILWCNRHKFLKRKFLWTRRFISKMDEYEAGANLIFKHKFHFAKAFLYNLIQRVAFFSMSYFVYLAFKSSFLIAEMSFIELFAIQVTIALCVDSLPLPGGVGISEYLYVLLFGLIYCMGDIDLVGSAMLLTRAVSFYVPLIVTFILVAIKHILGMKKVSQR